MNCNETTALVTGGGTGMGRSVAIALARAGCQVVIVGRREAKLQETVDAARPATVHWQCVDVADRESVETLVQSITEKFGGIDLLVHAAGVNIKNRTMAEMQPDQWDQIMAINATGAYNCMWAVLPQMRERKSGLIINITSVAGKRASDLGGIAYCASKFAATGLGTAVGLEEAKHGIRVTNIYPGEVDTPLLEQRPHPVSQEHRQRMLQPEDVAQLVVSLVELPDHAHVPELVIKPASQSYA
jgi:NADP-dependent 3-hydroxy acid dehydrogenase YdfG